MVGPKDDISQLVKYLLNKIVAEKKSIYADDVWGYTFTCSHTSFLPESFKIRFGGVLLEVLREDYVINLGAGKCALCLSESTVTDQWILGEIVMRRYYTMFD